MCAGVWRKYENLVMVSKKNSFQYSLAAALGFIESECIITFGLFEPYMGKVTTNMKNLLLNDHLYMVCMISTLF